jgi:(p)ppGpp synthase/HD superfamily hydrolase
MNTTYENIINAAIEFATEAHKGRKRKDEKDYITHPLAVARIARKITEGYSDETVFITQIAALFHDIAEDVEIYKNKEEFLLISFDKIIREKLFCSLSFSHFEFLLRVLTWLNKNNSSNYLEYILKIKNSNFAKYVKLADLQHNMSDLEEGSLKDKYRLAEYILKN